MAAATQRATPPAGAEDRARLMRPRGFAETLEGMAVAVAGFGVSGYWTARALALRGARVTVSERKTRSDLDPGLVEEILGLGVSLETGGHRAGTFERADLIVLSPGIRPEADFLLSSRATGIPVLGEMELAGRLTNTPILAVTGTNGKSTVTTFLGDLLARAGWKVFVGGNLGTPLMAYVAQGGEAEYAVLEVSSFQLDTIETFCPEISVILNITPDHLDRYPGMEAYARSKLRITQNQGPGQSVILNDEDLRLQCFRPAPSVSTLRYGMERKVRRLAWVEQGRVLVEFRAGSPIEFDCRSYRLPGRHNMENLLAVILGGLSAGIDASVIQAGIDHFEGLAHRLEWVGELRGVRFYDDSKATNVDATVRAVESFDRPVILIAGGRHKGGDYGPLVKAARGRVKALVLLGEARHLMAESFRVSMAASMAGDMEEAVSLAFARAEAGDVVLLAPACSSFDMFTDYAHRGRVFRETVGRLIGGASGHPKAGI